MHLPTASKEKTTCPKTRKYFWGILLNAQSWLAGKSIQGCIVIFSFSRHYVYFTHFHHSHTYCYTDTSDQRAAADTRADTELTWHDGVCDVEVIERQPQRLTRGGRGRAGGLGGRSGRLDGCCCWCGVTAGLETIVLRFQSLNLVLQHDKRMKKTK